MLKQSYLLLHFIRRQNYTRLVRWVDGTKLLGVEETKPVLVRR